MGKGTRLLLIILTILVYTGFVIGGTVLVVVMNEVAGTRAGRMPSFAKDLPRNFAEANTAFDEKMAVLFPKGTDEQAVIAYLRREGFHPSWDEPQTALFSKSIFPCLHKWSLRWKTGTGAEMGKLIAPIKGQYFAACL